MSLKLKDAKQGGDFVRPEPGTQPARCYAVVDLGTHTETGQFGTKTARKIQISWELPEETHVFDEKKGPQPFSVHSRYNFVMGKRAKLQIHLQGWRGRDFTAEELENFEIKNLLGKPCLLNLKENESNGKVFTNVESISPPMKGQTVKPQVNPSVYYDITMGKNNVFKKLPEFLQKYISECAEWNEAPAGEQPDDDGSFLGGLKDDVQDGAQVEDDGSDLPF